MFVADRPERADRRAHLDRKSSLGIEHWWRYPPEFSCKEGRPGCKVLEPRATVLCRFAKGACEGHLRAYSCFPRRPASQPVVCGPSIVVSASEAVLRALNHAPFTAVAADQYVDCGPSDRRRFQAMLCFAERFAGLEYLAQQMVGWNGADPPRLPSVQGNVIGSQPRPSGAPPHRSLVDASGETSGGRSRQDSDIAGPRHVVEIAGVASHPCHFKVTSEPRKRPIERPHKPRCVVLFASERCATPLITAIKKPDTGKAELGRNGVNLRRIRRTRSQEPNACQ